MKINRVKKNEALLYQVTVLVVSYNAKWDAMERTLISILRQKKINFEIIVADDGSQDNLFSLIDKLMEREGFQDYKLIASRENEGTVKNEYKGVLAAKGEYIKDISPGDLLYDEMVLFDFYQFATIKNYDILFGEAVYYYENEGKVSFLQNIYQPQNMGVYYPEHLTAKVKFNYLILNDWILGSNFFIKTVIFRKYLSWLYGKVKYLEDYSFVLAVADNQQIHYLKRSMVWYEFGTGISTNKNIYWGKILHKDEQEGRKILLLIIKKQSYWEYLRLKFYWAIRSGENKRGIRPIAKLAKLFIYPSLITWKIRKRLKKGITEQINNEINSIKIADLELYRRMSGR